MARRDRWRTSAAGSPHAGGTLTAVSKKTKSRQPRRYSTAKRPTGTRPNGSTARKSGQWRKMRSRRSRNSMWPWTITLTIIIAGGIGLVVASSGGGSSSGGNGSGAGSTGPLLASVNSAATGQTIDGIQCNQLEQTTLHVHAHVAVFVNGQQRSVPQGIGLAGGCFYWLHSHTADGIIHIESPGPRTHTLGNYFDIWRQPLSPTQVGPAIGPVTAYVGGQRFTGNPRDIKLGAHVLIQLDVGKDVAPKSFSFPSGL